MPRETLPRTGPYRLRVWRRYERRPREFVCDVTDGLDDARWSLALLVADPDFQRGEILEPRADGPHLVWALRATFAKTSPCE